MTDPPTPDARTLRRRYWLMIGALIVVSACVGLASRDVGGALFMSGVCGFSLGVVVLYLDGHRFFVDRRLRHGDRRAIHLLAVATPVVFVGAVVAAALGARTPVTFDCAAFFGILTGGYASFAHLARLDTAG